MPKLIPYTVIKDTREKDGWYFPEDDKCSGTEIHGLRTGDYTLKGYEEIVCIERKGSVSEVAINLGKNRNTFFREMERMTDFHFRYLLLEFSASDVINYPFSLLDDNDMQKYTLYKNGETERPKGKRFEIVEKSRMSGKFILKSLMEISITKNINIVFCDNKDNAILICNSIFKRLNELFNKEQNV